MCTRRCAGAERGPRSACEVISATLTEKASTRASAFPSRYLLHFFFCECRVPGEDDFTEKPLRMFRRSYETIYQARVVLRTNYQQYVCDGNTSRARCPAQQHANACGTLFACFSLSVKITCTAQCSCSMPHSFSRDHHQPHTDRTHELQPVSHSVF